MKLSSALISLPVSLFLDAPRPPKCPWSNLGPSWAVLGTFFSFGTHFGPSWEFSHRRIQPKSKSGSLLGAILESSWANLEPSWSLAGPTRSHLGAILGHLGPSCGHFVSHAKPDAVPVWLLSCQKSGASGFPGHLGTILGHLGAILGAMLGHLATSGINEKNIRPSNAL